MVFLRKFSLKAIAKEKGDASHLISFVNNVVLVEYGISIQDLGSILFVEGVRAWSDRENLSRVSIHYQTVIGLTIYPHLYFLIVAFSSQKMISFLSQFYSLFYRCFDCAYFKLFISC